MKSTDIVQPLAMASVFAEDVYSSSGTTNFEIPAATSSSATDTCVLDDGFLPITSESLDDGGIAPSRSNFNGMFYLSTDQRVFLQNGGIITFDSNVSTAIGGYPRGAVLGYVDSNGNFGYVKSLIDDNTYNFVTTPSYINGTYWVYALSSNALELIKTIYPVGSIYISTASTCPLASFFGTWQKVSSGRVLQGADSSHNPGSTIAAGLPNITGSGGTCWDINQGSQVSGAFYKSNTIGTLATGSSSYKPYHVNLNASRSSSIYGNSSTVQPAAYVVNIWQRTA